MKGVVTIKSRLKTWLVCIATFVVIDILALVLFNKRLRDPYFDIIVFSGLFWIITYYDLKRYNKSKK